MLFDEGTHWGESAGKCESRRVPKEPKEYLDDEAHDNGPDFLQSYFPNSDKDLKGLSFFWNLLALLQLPLAGRPMHI